MQHIQCYTTELSDTMLKTLGNIVKLFYWISYFVVRCVVNDIQSLNLLQNNNGEDDLKLLNKANKVFDHVTNTQFSINQKGITILTVVIPVAILTSSVLYLFLHEEVANPVLATKMPQKNVDVHPFSAPNKSSRTTSMLEGEQVIQPKQTIAKPVSFAQPPGENPNAADSPLYGPPCSLKISHSAALFPDWYHTPKSQASVDIFKPDSPVEYFMDIACDSQQQKPAELNDPCHLKEIFDNYSEKCNEQQSLLSSENGCLHSVASALPVTESDAEFNEVLNNHRSQISEGSHNNGADVDVDVDHYFDYDFDMSSTVHQSAHDPRVLIGWHIALPTIKLGTIGVVIDIVKRPFTTTKFLVELQDGSIEHLALQRSSNKGNVPFTLLEKTN